MKRGFLKNAKGQKALSLAPTVNSESVTLLPPSSASNPAKTPIAKSAAGWVLQEGGSTSSDETVNEISSRLEEALRVSRSESLGTAGSSVSPDVMKIVSELFLAGASLEQLDKYVPGFSTKGWKSGTIVPGSSAIPAQISPTSEIDSILELNKIYSDPRSLLIARVPRPLGPGSAPTDPDGHSVWVVFKPTMEKVLGAAPFITPTPKPKSATPAYVVKPTPDKGLGIFATRDIGMGELIFSERPLLVVPMTNSSIFIRLQDAMQGMDSATAMRFGMDEWEKCLAGALKMMLPDNREAFMKLANSHTTDGSGPILGIIRTNGFYIGSQIHDGDAERSDRINGYSGITKIGSRINHSCISNVDVDFSTPSFSFQIKASSDIKAGEELFYSYCNPKASVAERRAKLAPYGFVCHCWACDHATPEIDALGKGSRVG